jgi:uncharacterized protein (DUF488 family)
MKLYTIGHSSLGLEEFLQIIREHDVGWIADVRSIPFSRRFPHFSRPTLTQALKVAGIKYVYLGDKLGGKPDARDASKWTQGKMNYMLVSNLSRSQKWQAGIALLKEALGDQAAGNGCLLCSEADPNNCHRSLIAFEVEQSAPGVIVEHITPEQARDVSFQKALFMVSDDRGDYH